MYPDMEEARKNLWDLLAYACRYGHQQLDTLGGMTRDRVGAFVEALAARLKIENQGMQGISNRFATGG